jgi:hypothetical protein
VHEAGHLFGYGHTENPADVMFVGGAQWRAAWVCRRMIHRRTYTRRCARASGARRATCWPVQEWVRSAWPG